jgi:hypothetical protein
VARTPGAVLSLARSLPPRPGEKERAGRGRWAELPREHFVRGISIKEVARRFGIDRNTVRHALRSDRPPRYERERRPSKLDPFKEEIHELLKTDPKLPGVRVPPDGAVYVYVNRDGTSWGLQQRIPAPPDAAWASARVTLCAIGPAPWRRLRLPKRAAARSISSVSLTARPASTRQILSILTRGSRDLVNVEHDLHRRLDCIARLGDRLLEVSGVPTRNSLRAKRNSRLGPSASRGSSSTPSAGSIAS